jgi:YhcN/YlaJ family sporulation lipoprotein
MANLIKVGKKTALLAIVASTMVIGTVGCGGPTRDGSGANDGMRTRMLNNNAGDLRLGNDRYRGADPNLFRDASDKRLGMRRDNGYTGYDQDGVNRWSDYKSANNNHNNNRLEENREVAEQLTTMEPIEWASVMTSDNNAYVAVKVREGHNLETGHLKTQIADKVHTTHPQVKNVYVSANPDLISRFQQYSEQLSQGKPVSGLLSEFNKTMMQMFPSNASYGTNESYNNAENIPDSGMHGTNQAPIAPMAP